MKEFLRKLFGKKIAAPAPVSEPKKPEAPPSEPEKPETPAIPCTGATAPYVTRWCTFGNHLYRTPNEDSTVYYVDEQKGVYRMVVDKFGNIQNFPGIEKEDFWASEVSPVYLKPQIRFRTDLSRIDGRIAMLWQVQPDGRYWEDESGFGGESDVETILYSFLDSEGKFEAPFRIYSMGIQSYYPPKN